MTIGARDEYTLDKTLLVWEVGWEPREPGRSNMEATLENTTLTVIQAQAHTWEPRVLRRQRNPQLLPTCHPTMVLGPDHRCLQHYLDLSGWWRGENPHLKWYKEVWTKLFREAVTWLCIFTYTVPVVGCVLLTLWWDVCVYDDDVHDDVKSSNEVARCEFWQDSPHPLLLCSDSEPGRNLGRRDPSISLALSLSSLQRTLSPSLPVSSHMLLRSSLIAMSDSSSSHVCVLPPRTCLCISRGSDILICARNFSVIDNNMSNSFSKNSLTDFSISHACRVSLGLIPDLMTNLAYSGKNK